MIPFRCVGKIVNGKLRILPSPDLLVEWLSRHENVDVEIIIRKPKQDKTLPQLGYLFGHVIPAICDVTGYSEEEMYDILKFKFLRINKDTTWERVRNLSGIESDRAVVAKFIKDCVEFGQSLGADIYPTESYGDTE